MLTLASRTVLQELWFKTAHGGKIMITAHSKEEIDAEKSLIPTRHCFQKDTEETVNATCAG